MRTDTSTTHTSISTALATSWGPALMLWAVLSAMVGVVALRLPRVERSERGDIAAGMAWALLGVVGAIAIWAVLKTLGLDIVASMRKQLGV